MPFRGVTFSGQNVTPKNDGGLYQAHHGDGILWGCAMNISGDDLVIQSGEFIMGGRVVQVDGATNVDLSGRTLQTGYIQVIMNADLSQGEGSQWYTTFVESATTTFPALTQDDINGTDTLYQFELAVIQISGGNLSSIIQSMESSSVMVYSPVGDNELRAFSGDGGSGIAEYIDNGETRRTGLSFFTAGNIDSVWYGDGKDMHIRPKGVSDSAYQIVIYGSNGNINFGGEIIDNSKGSIQFNSGNVVLGPKTNGAIVLRPNGINSNVNQFYIDGNGYIHSQATYNRSAGGSANLVVASGGDFYRSTSLRKYKKDIRPITEEEAEKGYKLEPIGFHSNIEGDTKHELYGFIAEDVEEILPNLATHDEDDKVDGVAYDRVCAILLKQNQMLKARVDALEERVAKLEKEIGK